MVVLEWLKALFTRGGSARTSPGMITRTCKRCGRTFTLPEEVQHWPDYCQACRAKYRPAEPVTRTCRRCGQRFTFTPTDGRWPKYCPACRTGRKGPQ